MRAIGNIVFAIFASWFFSDPVIAGERVALVIGNSAYQNVSRLDNPANDASLMADMLKSLGFKLVGGGAQADLEKTAFDIAVQSFGRQLQGADVGLFYYAGHGVQVRGSNYLVPVNANPTREADVDFQMVDVNLVLTKCRVRVLGLISSYWMRVETIRLEVVGCALRKAVSRRYAPRKDHLFLTQRNRAASHRTGTTATVLILERSLIPSVEAVSTSSKHSTR
jgi:hypothetical protein